VSPEELAAHKKRFLDTMEKAWHDIEVAYKQPHFPACKATEMNVFIEMKFDTNDYVIACNPIIPMQGDFNSWAPTKTIKTG